jgi:hypothetical protein
MNHYDLGDKPDNIISEEDLKAVKESLSIVRSNVDKAEAFIMTLGLTEFELKVLVRRLLGEYY